MSFLAACVLANWMIVGSSSDKMVVDSFIRDGVKPDDFGKLTEKARKGRTHLAASGSGFFITDDGFILTNHHVVENSAEVVVVSGDVAYRAIVVAKSKKHDLALMKINLFPRMTNGVYNLTWTLPVFFIVENPALRHSLRTREKLHLQAVKIIAYC